MTTELVLKTFQEKFNIELKPEDPSYSLNWFRTEVEGFKFQLGVEEGLFKINVDFDFIGYDESDDEVFEYMDKVNKDVGNNKRMYLGEQDWYYRLLLKDGISGTIKSQQDIVALVHEFLEFANHENVKCLRPYL